MPETEADRPHPGQHDAATAAVARVLDALGPVRAHHDLFVPGTHDARIDHLAVGPTGVWAITTRAWGTPLTDEGGMLRRGRYPINLELTAARGEAERASARLGVEVRPVLCLVDTGLPHPVQEVGGVHVVSLDALGGLLASGPRVLDDHQQAEADRWAATMVERTELGDDRRGTGERTTDPGDSLTIAVGPALPVDRTRLRRRATRVAAAVAAAATFMYLYPHIVGDDDQRTVERPGAEQPAGAD